MKIKSIIITAIVAALLAFTAKAQALEWFNEGYAYAASGRNTTVFEGNMYVPYVPPTYNRTGPAAVVAWPAMNFNNSHGSTLLQPVMAWAAGSSNWQAFNSLLTYDSTVLYVNNTKLGMQFVGGNPWVSNTSTFNVSPGDEMYFQLSVYQYDMGIWCDVNGNNCYWFNEWVSELKDLTTGQQVVTLYYLPDQPGATGGSFAVEWNESADPLTGSALTTVQAYCNEVPAFGLFNIRIMDENAYSGTGQAGAGTWQDVIIGIDSQQTRPTDCNYKSATSGYGTLNSAAALFSETH